MASITANGQYYQLGYDSVRVKSKFKLGYVTTGAVTDSILTKKANGGVFKISQADFVTNANLALKANIASPTFTGTVTTADFVSTKNYTSGGVTPKTNTLTLGSAGVYLQNRNNTAGTTSYIGITDVGMFIDDSQFTKGIQYNADYSANYTNLSLITKGDLPKYTASLRQEDATAVPYTKTTLNSTYPSSPVGIKIICTVIGIVYEKYNTTDWFGATVSILN